jgi:hypothetical protein
VVPVSEPFRRLQDVSEVRREIREQQKHLRELQGELRQLEWGLLGGRSMFDPAKARKLCVVTGENLEHLAGEIDDLPRSVEEARPASTPEEVDPDE